MINLNYLLLYSLFFIFIFIIIIDYDYLKKHHAKCSKIIRSLDIPLKNKIISIITFNLSFYCSIAILFPFLYITKTIKIIKLVKFNLNKLSK